MYQSAASQSNPGVENRERRTYQRKTRRKWKLYYNGTATGVGFTLPSYKLLLLEKVRSAYVSKRRTLNPETIFVSEATSHAERT